MILLLVFSVVWGVICCAAFPLIAVHVYQEWIHGR